MAGDPARINRRQGREMSPTKGLLQRLDRVPTGRACGSPSMASEMLEAALAYAAGGFAVFPVYEAVASTAPDGRWDCACPLTSKTRDADMTRNPARTCGHAGKHPRTSQGFKDATRDREQIERWWTRWPEANIGVATGAASGVVALDVDPRHGGDDSLANLERDQGALPDAPRVLTGGGGLHAYFQHPGRYVPSRCGIAPGVDVKADGGYVLAPPSTHRSGTRYAWEVAAHLDDVPLAPVPAWLLRLGRTTTAGRRRSLGIRCDDLPLLIPEGERNDRLHRLGGAMRRWGFSEACLVVCLDAVNRFHCSPALDADEVADIGRSAARYEPALYPPRRFLRVRKP